MACEGHDGLKSKIKRNLEKIDKPLVRVRVQWNKNSSNSKDFY